jgi:VanZ family protein
VLTAAGIVAGSAGRWAPYEPGVWQPLLVVPADVARNVALYVPFGMFAWLTLDETGVRAVLRVVSVALLFSFAVETLQLYTADRVASLPDMLSAGVGSAVGASVVAWLRSAR